MSRILIAAGMLLIPAVAIAQTAQPVEKGEKVRCKRIGETGSHAKIKKVCRTERQWQQIRDDAKRDADELTKPTGAVVSGG
jgi:Spy/CpxP family protein refolding chaperone